MSLQYGAWATSKKLRCCAFWFNQELVVNKNEGTPARNALVARGAIESGGPVEGTPARNALVARGAIESGGPVEGTPARNATVVLALRSSPCRCHPSTLHQGRVS